MPKSTGNFRRYMWWKASLKILLLFSGLLFACLPPKKAVLPPPSKVPTPSKEVKEEPPGGLSRVKKASGEVLKESGRRLKVGLVLPFSEKETEKREAFLRGCFLGAGIFGPQSLPYRVSLQFDDKSAEPLIDPLVLKRSLEQKQMENLIETALKEGIKEVGILYPSSSTGERELMFLKKVLSESGLNVSFAKSYPPETTDFSRVLKDIKQFPQGLWVIEGNKVCLIASSLAFLGKPGVRILAPETDDPRRTFSSCGRYLEGALLGCSFYKESTRQEVRTFREFYKKTYAQEPDLWAFLGYESIRGVLEGDEKLYVPFILKIQGGRLREIP